MTKAADPRVLFGKNLKELRLKKSYSQESLAARAGLDRTYISGCERGVRNVSIVNIYKLAKALGVDPKQFF